MYGRLLHRGRRALALLACLGVAATGFAALGCSGEPRLDGNTGAFSDRNARDAATPGTADASTDAAASDAGAGFDFPDFGVDAGPGGPGTAPARTAPTEVPADWSCRPDFALDLVCDCGCSTLDLGCAEPGCDEPGCDAPSCEACFAADGRREPCDSPRKPRAPACSEQQLGDGVCDCGCGAPDTDCGAGDDGCVEPGCDDAACERCHDEFGRALPCATRFACDEAAYADGALCDCGCGTPDPDCGANDDGCVEPGCDAAGCDVRHDAAGQPLRPEGWSCAAGGFAGDDGCDCGCGATDPDCRPRQGGCSEPGCAEASCDRCHQADGSLRPCRFACELSHYATNDGCDCGCGDTDPDCGALGCSEPGCFAAACTRCSEGQGGPGGCEQSACDASVWNDGVCDCGCREPDPDCAGVPSCLTPGCSRSSCGRCHDADGAPIACDDFYCTFEKQGGGDGCNCGCGAEDPDCGGDGCATPGCQAEACVTCRTWNGAPMSCAP